MKLSSAILAVMIDGKEHSLDEIRARIRHLIDPSKAVRLYCNRIRGERENCRKRNSTGRTIPSARKEMPEPEAVDVARCIDWLVKDCVMGMSHTRGGNNVYLTNVDGNGTWKLKEESRPLIRSPQVAGAVAQVIRNNLIAKGEMI